MGEFYALACAVVWGLAVVFFRRSGETVPPLAMNLFRSLVSLLLFAVTMLVRRQPLLPEAPAEDYVRLLASGVIAIALADTLFHASLNRIGAGLNAIVDTLYSPFVIVFAYLLLGEKAGPWQLGGMALIIGGVMVATRVDLPAGTTRRSMAAGIALGGVSMATLAFGIVIAKPALERADVVWATAVRQVASVAVLLPAALIHPSRRAYLAALRPQRAWRFTVTGSVLGSYIALMLWIAGMKYTAVGRAAVLNQTSTIAILAFAALFLGERFDRRKAVAATLALLGVILVLAPWR
ncbi:MAG TPA: DMT family transporter [Candidatus Krumholzibacteria bacterium]|nr:DMT family transporter [Candidatus Krumholzibacteria bacterium]